MIHPTTQPFGTWLSLPRRLLVLLSGARFVAAAFFGCLASAIFYAATALALFVVVIFTVSNTDMDGALFGPLLVLGFFFVGLAAALIVYTPITLLTAILARKHTWVWFVAPLLIVGLSFAAGIVFEIRSGPSDPEESLIVRAAHALALPYFFAGGYCVYWLFVFTPCQLGPWLVGKLKQG